MFDNINEPDSCIIGIVLVRNEDCFLKQVLENISGFCDRIIVADNYSNDNTPAIIDQMSERYEHLESYRIKHMNESHTILEPLAGGENWVFAVDGDEIYDPVGLERFRRQIKKGAFDEWWVIFGNVLNCTSLDRVRGIASGYLAPPSRSMTKLYNFNAIHRWSGSSGERLHGGTIEFKKGWDKSKRYNLYAEVSWEEADFRCLHACFLQRSSIQKSKDGVFLARPNPADIMTRSIPQKLVSFMKGVCGVPETGKVEWKQEKFSRGELVKKDVSVFFRSV